VPFVTSKEPYQIILAYEAIFEYHIPQGTSYYAWKVTHLIRWLAPGHPLPLEQGSHCPFIQGAQLLYPHKLHNVSFCLFI
jgi:hypothetical protein